MRITRYLAFNVLTRSVAALALFVVVYSAVDFVEVSSQLRSIGNLAGARGHLRLFAQYPLRLPMIAAHVLPLSLMIGVQTALSSFRRRGEWNALCSAGLSPIRLAVCLLIIPFIGAFVSSALLAEVSPTALGMWESSFGPNKEGPINSWCEKGNLLIKEEDEAGFGLAVERDLNGAPIYYSARSKSRADTWTLDNGWQIGTSHKDSAACGTSARKRAASLLDLQGASLTSKDLGAAILQSENRGWETAPLKAEAALRIALAAACLAVPLLSLGLGLGGGEPRATRLVGRGVAAAAVFWLFLATAWNGAVVGAWSPVWVSVAVPLIFFATGFVLVIVNGRR
jgi:lipopolysaccharide export LptBFGC system permease protein LptF